MSLGTAGAPRRVAVIGAGATGSMAAIFAARGGATTTLLEATRDGGRKILISGGGRCNVLPMHLDESRFVTDSSRNLLNRMLRAWPLRDQIAFFETELGLPLVEEAEMSKLFPRSNKARDATGGFLFTHHGYSGPSVLDVSHVVARAKSSAATRLTIQWTELSAAEWEEALRPQGNRTVTGVLRASLPERLAAVLLALANVDATRSLAELRRAERIRLIETMVSGELPWTGDEGYRKAEVTGGGVSLAEVHAQTMESKRHPGLYICGEVLDAFGPVGGYNFYWAWATGRAAGIGASSDAGRVSPSGAQ
jgi:predicted flavoprotein YhiN